MASQRCNTTLVREIRGETIAQLSRALESAFNAWGHMQAREPHHQDNFVMRDGLALPLCL